MNRLITFLEGKKSYIVAVLLAIYSLLKALSLIVTTPEIDIAVYGLLASLFGVAIRKAIK